MIFKYYSEIKNRSFLIVNAWFFSILTTYYYKETLLFLCLKPSLISKNDICYFIFTDVRDIFTIYLKLTFFIGNQILIFLIIFHLFVFLSLGLYKFEYKYIKKTLTFSFLFWTCSLLVFNNVLLPVSLNFFLSFQKLISFTSLTLHFEAKITEYLNFYLLFYYACIFYCQLFIVLVFFFDYINLNLKLIQKYRKVFYYFFVLISTLVTPPDVTSQILFSIILILFYELFTLLNFLKFSYSSLKTKKRKLA